MHVYGTDVTFRNFIVQAPLLALLPFTIFCSLIGWISTSVAVLCGSSRVNINSFYCLSSRPLKLFIDEALTAIPAELIQAMGTNGIHLITKLMTKIYRVGQKRKLLYFLCARA